MEEPTLETIHKKAEDIEQTVHEVKKILGLEPSQDPQPKKTTFLRWLRRLFLPNLK